MSKSEIRAVALVIELSCTHGSDTGLTHKAAKQILSKLYLRLLGRSMTLKEKSNSISFSIPELWAFTVQSAHIMHLVGTFEKVVVSQICSESHRLTS